MTEFEITLFSVFAAFLVLGGYSILLLYRKRHTKKGIDWRTRLGQILPSKDKQKEALSLLKEHPSPDTFFVSKLPKVEGMKEWIQHTGLDISPLLLVLFGGLAGIAIGLFLIFLLKANLVFSILFGMASAFFLPWIFITVLSLKRKNKFLEGFPIALDIIRRALRAGHSADRALEMAAEHSSGPVQEAFRTIVDKMRLGEPPEQALGEMANRIGIDDFRMLAIVIILQRETGGSLAEAIENFSKIIRARQNLRKKMKALSAEVRVTALILTAIPFFILGAVYITSPRYLDDMFYTENGRILLLIGGAMLCTGIIIIIRMAYKEIY